MKVHFIKLPTFLIAIIGLTHTSLSWISVQGKQYQPFEENRIQEIRKNSEIRKGFSCEGKTNPAEFVTCRKCLNNLQENSFGKEVHFFYLTEIFYILKGSV